MFLSKWMERSTVQSRLVQGHVDPCIIVITFAHVFAYVDACDDGIYMKLEPLTPVDIKAMTIVIAFMHTDVSGSNSDNIYVIP